MSIRNSVIDVLVDASARGLDAFDDVGAGARGMAADLESAASKADSAAGKFDGLGSSADDLDDKAGRATGALGALSAGFELIGAEGAAQGLQSAAMATDFLSGASQALTLIMDLEIAKKVASTVATAAQTVATTAQSAASKAAAAAQWALNAALSANPLGVVIALLVATAAAVVIAYKRSETFRDIVKSAMAIASSAFDGVSDAVSTVVDWLRDKVPAAFSWIQGKAAGIIDTAFAPFSAAKTLAENFRDFIRDKIEPAVSTMKAAVVPVLDALSTPINAAIDAVESLIGWISRIDFPSPPDWLNKLPGFGRVSLGANPAAAAVAPVTITATTDPAVVANLVAILGVLQGIYAARPSTTVDTSTLARLLADLLRREGILYGTATR